MKTNKIVILLFLLLISAGASAQKYRLLVGSAANAESTDGIYEYQFDAASGQASYETKAVVNRPSYFAMAPDGRHLYSITEAANVSSFSFNAATGAINFINKQSSGGAGPIHISAERSGKYLFAANYDGGSLSTLPVHTDGGLGPAVQTIVHQGSSVDPVRQSKPYSHSAVLTPDNKYVVNPDLGMDKITLYRFDRKAKSEPLSVSSVLDVKPGSGPRFFTFHPNKKFAYVVQEMGGMVTEFKYKSGRLTAVQSISMLREGFTGRSGAADIHISPDGKFLYASNRGDANELTIFSIDQRTGSLTVAGRFASQARNPRYFAIDPSGNFLLLTNQGSDNIAILKRDQNTGLLTATGQQIAIVKPVCLLFVK